MVRIKILLKNMEVTKKHLKVTAKKIKLMVTQTKDNNEYIWYCPRDRCGVILMKTKEHFLSGSGTIKCYRCNVTHTFKKLMSENKHNIDKYIKKT